MKIEYASIEKYKLFNEAVTSICNEEKYLINSTGFTDEQTKTFVEKILDNNFSQFYVIEDEKVIGWCDIIPKEQEFHRHVGVLGMGIVAGYRGKGIGTELITKTINHAHSRGIERVELEVFFTNKIAQKLYKKIGFVQEGIKRKAKKHKGEYEDVIIMGLI